MPFEDFLVIENKMVGGVTIYLAIANNLMGVVNWLGRSDIDSNWIGQKIALVASRNRVDSVVKSIKCM